MSGATKGVNLKRFKGDRMMGREIYCYDLFHHYGIWTAPRASYTRVIINLIEDNESVTSLDYGVYEMFEDIGKQFVKSRQSEKLDDATGTKGLGWGNKTGTLWKRGTSGGDLNDPNASMGVEDAVLMTDRATSEAASKFYAYDLKVDKDKLTGAQAQLRTFITELQNCKVTTPEEIAATKAWYESRMDVDFFLKTLAVSVLTGMDDDYWGNANNFYLYFSSGKNNAGTKDEKFYYIPYDYDNTLGHEIKNPKAYQRDILKWKGNGNEGPRPLVEKALAVPEFKKIYIDYLDEISKDSYFLNESSSRIQRWQSMISPYTNSTDILYDYDVPKYPNDGDWVNVFEHFSKMRDNVAYWTAFYNKDFSSSSITFNFNADGYSDKTVTDPSKFSTPLVELACEYMTAPGGGSYLDSGAFKEIPTVGSGENKKYFRGWTRTKDSTDYVYRYDINTDTALTVYAKWESVSELTQPVALSADGSEFVYTFHPTDFLYTNLPSKVVMVGGNPGWGWNPNNDSECIVMTKQANGDFVYREKIKVIEHGWYDNGTWKHSWYDWKNKEGFHFVVDGDWASLKGDEDWINEKHYYFLQESLVVPEMSHNFDKDDEGNFTNDWWSDIRTLEEAQNAGSWRTPGIDKDGRDVKAGYKSLNTDKGKLEDFNICFEFEWEEYETGKWRPNGKIKNNIGNRIPNKYADKINFTKADCTRVND